MNKTVTSFWKGLFFKGNIDKVRKASDWFYHAE